MHAPNVIPFRPYASVALQLQRLGADSRERRDTFFARVRAELAKGHNGKAVAGEVRAEFALRDSHASLDGAA